MPIDKPKNGPLGVIERADWDDWVERVYSAHSGDTFSIDDLKSLFEFASRVGYDHGAGGGSLAEWLEGWKRY